MDQSSQTNDERNYILGLAFFNGYVTCMRLFREAIGSAENAKNTEGVSKREMFENILKNMQSMLSFEKQMWMELDGDNSLIFDKTLYMYRPKKEKDEVRNDQEG